MPVNSFLQRTTLVALIISLGVFITIYSLNDWFHHSFLFGLGLPQPLGDAVGAVLIVLFTYLAQRIVSLAFYKDVMFGLASEQKQAVGKVSDIEAVGKEVAKELEGIRKYNDVLRNQLNAIIQATEKAAYDITNRLLAIDTVVTSLDSFVAQTSSDSSLMLQSSEQSIAGN
ncbi:MAG: chemotaxis protein, partial [Azonexus sp.]|nr:chemotaxis protein [Azonexus sp.]